jgi:lactate dehydrogenase-like 2-hydroxyacid dehydrogenase
MWPDTFATQFDAPRMARLDELCRLERPAPVDLDDPSLGDRLARVEVLVTSWGAPTLTGDRLDRMPKLRAVFHGAGTVRPLVTDEFWERGIVITSAAEANAIPVAEFAYAQIVLAGKRAQYLARVSSATGGAPSCTPAGTPTTGAGSASWGSPGSVAGWSPTCSSSTPPRSSSTTPTPTPTPSPAPVHG